jgi:ATP-dependent helicase/nuclease subunit A
MTTQSAHSTARDEPARELLRGDRFMACPVSKDPALKLNRNIIVRAGAGSGKTTILIDRMIVLVRSGVAPSSIVAITFTNRAAAELRERFFTRLLEVREALEEKNGAEWIEERQRVADALRHSDEVFIGTIHAFCLRLLRQRSLHAGLPPDFRQVEESDELNMRQAFWQQRVEEAHATGDPEWTLLAKGEVSWSGIFNLFGMLSSNQSVRFEQSGAERPDLSAVFTLTRLMIEALESIVPPSEDPDEFMTALDRARLRLAAASEDDFKRIRVLKALMEGMDGSDDPSLKITLNRWDSQRTSDLYKLAQRIKKGEDDLVAGRSVKDVWSGPIRDAVLAWDAWLHDVALRFAGQAVEAYRRYRVQLGLLTYDDLLHEATRLVLTSAPARRVFQERYRYLLVDEFQDTDPAQAALLFGLCSLDPDAGDWAQSKLQPGKLFVVGDDKQSIYRFRKADFQVFATVAEAVVRDGGKEVGLTANFRTDEALCEWINTSVGEIFAQQEEPHQARWERLEPAKGRFGPEQPVVHLAVCKSGQRAQKPRIVAEAAVIAERIRASVASGQSSFGDHMILVRTHTNVPIFLDMFSRLRIPVSLPGGKQKGAESVVRMIHDLFRVLLKPDDGVALIATLRGILFGIKDSDLQAYCGSGTAWEHMLHNASTLDGAPQAVQMAARTLSRWAETFRKERPGIAFELFLADSGVEGALRSEPNGELLTGMLERIGSLMVAWDMQGFAFAACVHELGRYRSGELNLEPYSLDEPFGECVRILTVHSSKGLQAPFVYLADCLPDTSYQTRLHIWREGGQLLGSAPILRGKAPFEAVELKPRDWSAYSVEEARFEQAEGNRLLYVAATRAQFQLIVSAHAEADKRSGTWDVLGPYFDDPRVERIEVDPQTTDLPELPEVMRQEQDRPASEYAAPIPFRLPLPTWSLKRPSEKDHPHVSGQEATAFSGISEGMLFGSAVHALFEVVVARRKEGISFDDVQQLATEVMERRFGSGHAPYLIKNATDALLAFLESAVWETLHAADRVLTEVPFTTESHSGDLAVVTSGVVDLAFRSHGHWTIVDYKTDRASLPEVRARHAPQIEAYVRAWTALFPDEPCNGLIWSTEHHQAVSVMAQE